MDATARPRVAVVIPCYDDGATLPEALASLDQQEAHELVVVDDGSGDPRTLDAFARAEAAGVRVLHQANAGLSAARTAGLCATSAPYVLALDADDRLVAGALTALADALDAAPQAAAAWGDLETFGRSRSVQRLSAGLDPWLITYMNGLTADALFRRAALVDVGAWTYAGGGYEDWDLWMALAERGWAGAYVPGVRHSYRLHGSRMLRDARENHDELYAELRERHRDLFARRGEHWRSSVAPLRLRLLLPLFERVPGLSGYTRLRLTHFVKEPAYLGKLWLVRRLSGARRGVRRAAALAAALTTA
jgi:glycosyltransferase involved in cell wall biosynthesis